MPCIKYIIEFFIFYHIQVIVVMIKLWLILHKYSIVVLQDEYITMAMEGKFDPLNFNP